MQITFHGATGEVTGSCFLLDTGRHRVLIECGMMQGGRNERSRNAAKFPFDVRDIDAVIVTHGHIDHIGRLPLLVKRGYKGPIHAQRATAELARVMLEDAASLAISDTERRNRAHQRRGQRTETPLYDLDDVADTLKLLVGHEYDRKVEVLPDLVLRLRDAGHILGAASLEMWVGEGEQVRKIVVSGDIGPRGTPILRDPQPIQDADMVLLESTYGDRLHRPRADTVAEMGDIFRQAAAEKGKVLIPAFAVGRSQEILWWLAEHFDDWGLKPWRIFLDSPMALRVVELYNRHTGLFGPQARERWQGEGNPFRMSNLRMVSRNEDSMAINKLASGVIVIAGSGMCNGGRILHHLRHNAWKENTHIIFSGYQAQGTLGRQLVNGEKFVTIYGEKIHIRAKVHTIGGLSAHADQNGLAEWYGHFRAKPPVWLVHGEDKAREGLAARLRDFHGAEVHLPAAGETVAVPSAREEVEESGA
ncbi:MAG TPA: MBL fold metallo-hydrolase [Xanthomonadaceae bacterium]|nr:MBL fold metallo-hydrolase [Xanthomonadaceae bacterium]